MKILKLITILTCFIAFQNINATLTFSNEMSKFILLNEESEIRIKETGIYDNLDLGITSNLNNIDLINSTSNLIIMNNDFELDAGYLLSVSGTLQGNGYSMILYGDLIIPEMTTLKITSSLLIEGNGHTLLIDKFAQLLTDTHATVTLRNLILRNALNTPEKPALAGCGSDSKIAFDNVNINFGDDFWFKRGSMYFHNNNIYSGGSKMIYNSIQPIFVAPDSTLMFDKNTTLFYCPENTNQNLIIPQDPSSILYFDGATLQTTPTGLSLKEGYMFFENQVNLDVGTEFNIGSFILYQNSCGIDLRSMDWNYNGEFLAVSGKAVSGSDQIKLYQLDTITQAINQIDSLSFGSLSSIAHCVAWSADGIYLAIGGCGASSSGGFSNSNNLRIYSFDHSTLTLQPITSIDFGSTSTINSVDWGGIDGYYLALGGEGALPVGDFNNNDNLRVYHFDRKLGNLNPAASYDFGDSVKSAKWSLGGLYLAVGGYQNPNCDLELLYFDAVSNSLTNVDTKTFGIADETYINKLAWTKEGQFLAVGGGSYTDYTHSYTNITIYKFNPANTPALSFATLASPVETVRNDYLEIKDLIWNPESSLLLYTGLNPRTNTWSSDVYYFDSSLTASLSEFKQLSKGSASSQYCAGGNPRSNLFTTGFYDTINVNSLIDISPKVIDTEDYTDYYSTTSGIYSINWHPSGNYLVVAGSGASEIGGFSDTNGIRIYRFGTLSEVLDPITSQAYGEKVCSSQWSPDGEYLAVGGINPSYIPGVFNNYDHLRIYRFANNALSPILSVAASSGATPAEIYSVAWHPSGKYIAIGCYNTENIGGFLSSTNLRIYSFNENVLIPVAGYDFGANTITPAAIEWSADGKYIAVGTCDGQPMTTTDPTSGVGLHIFEFDVSSTATIVKKATWNPSNTAVLNLSWVFDNRFIAANYNSNYNPLSFAMLYFNGNSIEEIQNWKSYTGSSNVDFFNSDVKFSPDGTKIAYASKNGANNNFGYLEITDVDLKNDPYHYQKVNGAFNIYSIDWRPDSKYIALGSFNVEKNAPQIAILKVNNLININRENLNGLDFGKLIELNLLGNALINVNGFVRYGVEY